MGNLHGRRRAITLGQVLLIAAVILLLALLLLSRAVRPFRQKGQVVCANNLRGTGQALAVYSHENDGHFPVLPISADATIQGSPETLRWRGQMGSQAGLTINAQAVRDADGIRGSSSRALFHLISVGLATPGQMICPESGDTEDGLRNFGPDASNGGEEAATPGLDRFDFTGPSTLSFGIDLEGLTTKRRGRPVEKISTSKVIMADKGPFSIASGDTLPGTRTMRDVDAGARISDALRQMSDSDLVRLPHEKRTSLNSRNHGGSGQNLLFLGGHTEWKPVPWADEVFDNIYTRWPTASRPAAVSDRLLGVTQWECDETAELNRDDSFLVP